MKKLLGILVLGLLFCNIGFAENFNPAKPIWEQYPKIICQGEVLYTYKVGKLHQVPTKPIWVSEIDFNKNMIVRKIIVDEKNNTAPLPDGEILDKYFYYGVFNDKPINTIYLGSGRSTSFFVSDPINKITSITYSVGSNEAVMLNHGVCSKN